MSGIIGWGSGEQNRWIGMHLALFVCCRHHCCHQHAIRGPNKHIYVHIILLVVGTEAHTHTHQHTHMLHVWSSIALNRHVTLKICSCLSAGREQARAYCFACVLSIFPYETAMQCALILFSFFSVSSFTEMAQAWVKRVRTDQLARIIEL